MVSNCVYKGVNMKNNSIYNIYKLYSNSTEIEIWEKANSVRSMFNKRFTDNKHGEKFIKGVIEQAKSGKTSVCFDFPCGLFEFIQDKDIKKYEEEEKEFYNLLNGKTLSKNFIREFKDILCVDKHNLNNFTFSYPTYVLNILSKTFKKERSTIFTMYATPRVKFKGVNFLIFNYKSYAKSSLEVIWDQKILYDEYGVINRYNFLYSLKKMFNFVDIIFTIMLLLLIYALLISILTKTMPEEISYYILHNPFYFILIFIFSFSTIYAVETISNRMGYRVV